METGARLSRKKLSPELSPACTLSPTVEALLTDYLIVRPTLSPLTLDKYSAPVGFNQSLMIYSEKNGLFLNKALKTPSSM